MITSAKETEAGPGSDYLVTYEDGKVTRVPNEPSNTQYYELMDWVAEGNVIQPYVAPPPPTDDERIDGAFPQTDTARVIFEALYELANDVRTLKGQATITRVQLRDWLKSKLP